MTISKLFLVLICQILKVSLLSKAQTSFLKIFCPPPGNFFSRQSDKKIFCFPWKIFCGRPCLTLLLPLYEYYCHIYTQLLMKLFDVLLGPLKNFTWICLWEIRPMTKSRWTTSHSASKSFSFRYSRNSELVSNSTTYERKEHII